MISTQSYWFWAIFKCWVVCKAQYASYFRSKRSQLSWKTFAYTPMWSFHSVDGYSIIVTYFALLRLSVSHRHNHYINFVICICCLLAFVNEQLRLAEWMSHFLRMCVCNIHVCVAVRRRKSDSMLISNSWNKINFSCVHRLAKVASRSELQFKKKKRYPRNKKRIQKNFAWRNESKSRCVQNVQ